MRNGIVVSLLLHVLVLVPLLFIFVPTDNVPSSPEAIPTHFVAHTVNIEALQPKRPPPLEPQAAPPSNAPEPVTSKAEEAVTVAPVQPETVKPARPEPQLDRVALQEPERRAEPRPVQEADRPRELEPQPELEPPPEQQALENPGPLPEPVATKPEPVPIPKAEPPPEPEPVPQEQATVAEAQPPAREERVAARHGLPAPRAAPPTAGESAEPDLGYLMRVRALLEQYKRYPPMAQRLRMEGEVRLWFVLNRQGEVLDYRIDKGSGHAMLDEEVQRLIEQIDAFPPVPLDFGPNRLELVVPVSFRLTG